MSIALSRAYMVSSKKGPFFWSCIYIYIYIF